MTLAFSLDRTVVIRARRATVFRYFTDAARFARWWGEGSSIDGRVGGEVRICYPGGTLATGVVQELVADERIAFTYGYVDPAKPIPPGGSLVTITLEDVAEGTRLVLRHDLATAAARDEHVQGWKYQLAVFARLAGDDALAAAPAAIAAWFAAWNEPDAAARAAQLAPVVDGAVTFRDGVGCTAGLDELLAHIGACHRFMPGVRVEPRGQPRCAHGVALADFALIKPDGTAALQGTNVFRLAPSGAIVDVVGVA